MQPKKKKYAKEIITKKNRENFLTWKTSPKVRRRKNHGTFVGVHPNIHYNNLGTKPNSKLGSTPSFQHNHKMHFKIPKTMKSSNYSE